MSIEQDFSDHKQMLLVIQEAQDAEQDQREIVQEQKEFILLKDGQWDSRTVQLMDGRYRGTFDQVSPILEQITGEMDGAEFAIDVSPAGGDATEDTAETMGGLMRNIENISNADQIYSSIGESMVMAGLDGFEIVQEHLDANTFDQDLIFKPISDFYKSVWFDLAAVKQDKSDANWGIKLREMPAANYDKQFPDGSGISIGDSITTEAATDKYQSVTVGKLYYKKPIDVELVKMSDGSVYVKDSKFKQIQDELALKQITVADERTRKSWRVWSRLLDGGDWLKEEQETVFSYIPLVPVYGNYSILDTKNIYFGKTLKLMDSQRGVNFAMSAKTEDVALSPNDAIWMTKEQGAGEDYSKMNIDKKPVRFYKHVDNQTMPGKMGMNNINPGLQASLNDFQVLLQKTGNMDDPSMGQNPGLQSGVAVNALVQQSNNGNVKWFKSMEIGICHGYRICIDAIPRVYDGTRQQRILAEDGTGKMVSLNTTEVDRQTQEVVSINDMTKGVYDVTCSMGAAFKNQQEKTTRAIIDYASVDPAVMEMGRDILLKNQTSPGMDTLAARFRPQMIQNGLIPESQWTDEERQEIEQQQALAANQPQQPDPAMVLAQAEQGKAQAELQNAANKQVEVQANTQVKMAETQLKNDQLAFDVQKFIKGQDDKFNVDAANIQINAAKQELAERTQQFNEVITVAKQQQQEVNDAIANLKTIQDASGDVTIVGPGLVNNLKTQSDIVSKEQSEQD